MPPDRPLGRRPTLTPGLHAAIVEAVARGVPYIRAAQMLGIKPDTAHEWLQRGEGRMADRPATPALTQFAQDVHQAEAANEARHIQILREASLGTLTTTEIVELPDGTTRTTTRTLAPQWQASAWFLERCYPERYALRNRMDVTVQIQELAAVVATKLGVDPDALLAQAQALLEGGAYARNGT